MITEYLFDIQLFAHANPFVPGTTPGTPTTNPVNLTTDDGFSPTMKVFAETSLLENSREANIFGQFTTKQRIKGNTVEWRKWNKFPKATTPLKEGVIPSGQNFGMTVLTAKISQHGEYAAISDRLEAEAKDDVIVGATEEMGAAGGETKDILTRNVMSASTEIAYAPKVDSDGTETPVTDRAQVTSASVITPRFVAKVATWMKKNNVPKIDGKWIWIIHPSVAFDLRESNEWKEFHKYANVAPIYNGEIGELHGFKFIESNNCKVTKEGMGSAATYESYVFGRDAVGEVDPEGEGMELIIKGKEYGGPLNQFSTVGFKFSHGAVILYPERFLLAVSGSSAYGDIDEEN
jgi:N4-gp56 family major capsid protein